MHLRRPGPLRHPAGQVGRPGGRYAVRGHDGGRRRSRDLGHPVRTEEFRDARLCGLHGLRSRQRNGRDGGEPLHRPLVQGRRHGPGHGAAPGDRPPGHRLRAGHLPETGRPAGGPRLLPRRNRPSRPPGHGAHGRRTHPLGRVRGVGCEAVPPPGRHDEQGR